VVWEGTPGNRRPYPDLGTTLDAVEEQRIHVRKFSGGDVTDAEG